MENIFQRPPILMRLTMLTRDKISLLRAASLRTARETAHGLNDRKQMGWVEAGILPLNYSRLSCCFHRRMNGFWQKSDPDSSHDSFNISHWQSSAYNITRPRRIASDTASV